MPRSSAATRSGFRDTAVDLQLIGSGPSDNDIDWTHRFFQQIYSDRPYNNPSFTRLVGASLCVEPQPRQDEGLAGR